MVSTWCQVSWGEKKNGRKLEEHTSINDSRCSALSLLRFWGHVMIYDRVPFLYVSLLYFPSIHRRSFPSILRRFRDLTWTTGSIEMRASHRSDPFLHSRQFERSFVFLDTSDTISLEWIRNFDWIFWPTHLAKRKCLKKHTSVRMLAFFFLYFFFCLACWWFPRHFHWLWISRNKTKNIHNKDQSRVKSKENKRRKRNGENKMEATLTSKPIPGRYLTNVNRVDGGRGIFFQQSWGQFAISLPLPTFIFLSDWMV